MVSRNLLQDRSQSSLADVGLYIPTRNPNPLLEKCLSALTVQTVPTDFRLRFVAIVLNSTRARHKALAEELVTRFQKVFDSAVSLRLLVCPSPGIPSVRNYSIEDARAQQLDLLSFIDDDCEPAANWLETMLEQLSKSGADAAASAWMYQALGHRSSLVPTSVFDFQAYPIYRSTSEGHLYTSVASTRAVVFRLEKLETTNGSLRFDERFRDSGGSDTDFFLRWLQAKNSILFCPHTFVVEWLVGERLLMRWFLKRSFRRGFIAGREARPSLSRKSSEQFVEHRATRQKPQSRGFMYLGMLLLNFFRLLGGVWGFLGGKYRYYS